MTVGVGSSARADFGFTQVVSDITGIVFSDANDGDCLRDTGEGGVEGIYLYVDLDGDNRPDLGEPAVEFARDGTYSINFPGPGTYTVRPVVPPGFELTFPASGEHTVVFNGVALTENFDFGFLPSSDFGDAPDSYGTTIAADGASHGITAGLNIGATVDREIDGQPTSQPLVTTSTVTTKMASVCSVRSDRATPRRSRSPSATQLAQLPSCRPSWTSIVTATLADAGEQFVSEHPCSIGYRELDRSRDRLRSIGSLRRYHLRTVPLQPDQLA